MKFLDAWDWLSVQVHPDDESVRRSGPARAARRKPGSCSTRRRRQVYAGLLPGVDEARLRAALRDGTVADCLHPSAAARRLSVSAGRHGPRRRRRRADGRGAADQRRHVPPVRLEPPRRTRAIADLTYRRSAGLHRLERRPRAAGPRRGPPTGRKPSGSNSSPVGISRWNIFAKSSRSLAAARGRCRWYRAARRGERPIRPRAIKGFGPATHCRSRCPCAARSLRTNMNYARSAACDIAQRPRITRIVRFNFVFIRGGFAFCCHANSLFHVIPDRRCKGAMRLFHRSCEQNTLAIFAASPPKPRNRRRPGRRSDGGPANRSAVAFNLRYVII